MADVYWDSAYRADRERLLAGVARFWPFASVLDIGCNSGPVRRRLRERFGPGFAYVGVDVNEEALDQARRHAADDEQAVFQRLDVRCDLGTLPDASLDVVVSTSVLEQFDPETTAGILAHLRRIARLGVVVLETYGHEEAVSGRGWAHAYPEWVVTC